MLLLLCLYVHLVDLKYRACVYLPKDGFPALMFIKSADGCAEQNTYQSQRILLFLTALRGLVHHFQRSSGF